MLAHCSYGPYSQAMVRVCAEESFHYKQGKEAIINYRNLSLLAPLPDEMVLIDEGIVPDTAVLLQAWRAKVIPFLQDVGLTIPDNDTPKLTDRSQHTEHLVDLLGEMQMVARLDPQAEW